MQDPKACSDRGCWRRSEPGTNCYESKQISSHICCHQISQVRKKLDDHQRCSQQSGFRNLFNETVEHCSKKEQFGQKLSEFALVRTQLAKMASKLYALESTAYMTAGLADASIDGDIEVESVITRQLASDTADFIVNNCLQLLGSSVHHESSKYQQYLRDSTVLV